MLAACILANCAAAKTLIEHKPSPSELEQTKEFKNGYKPAEEKASIELREARAASEQSQLEHKAKLSMVFCAMDRKRSRKRTPA